MSVIYVLSDNGKLSKRNETIVFTQTDGTSVVLFPFKTEQLILIGKVTVTGDVLRMLARYKIPVAFLYSNGRFNARIVYSESKNVFLRQKQYAVMSNSSLSLEIARSIVTGKIRNQIAFMQRIKRKTDNDHERIKLSIGKIKNNLAQAEKATDVNSLRGFEGMAARNYFEVFALNIQCPWAVFKSRSKNPPQSNVNAVLSFLYTLLMYRVESALETQGLDTMAGNLHAPNYGRISLVFDLTEEFRVPVADSVCCSLFNLGILKETDFETHDFSESDDNYPLESECPTGVPSESAMSGILLTKEGIKKTIAAFEEKINSEVLYENEGRLSYQRIILEQTKIYKRVINAEETEYKTFYFK